MSQPEGGRGELVQHAGIDVRRVVASARGHKLVSGHGVGTNDGWEPLRVHDVLPLGSHDFSTKEREMPLLVSDVAANVQV